MRKTTAASRSVIPALLVGLALAGPAVAAEVTYNLRSEATHVTLPDGTAHLVWGYRLASDPPGSATLRGPTLSVSAGDTLRINLTNDLAEPTSIVVAGLRAETLTPQFFPGGRVRSFGEEAAGGGGSRTYRWLNVQPGTYLYESGTDPAKQVQLGLYGVVIVRPTPADQAYADPDTAFDNEVVLVLSELDPAFHLAVEEGRYVPEETPGTADPGEITSTVDHRPKYFLLNGRPYADPYTPFSAGRAGETTLVRLANAGLRAHSMTIQGLRMETIGMDGGLLTHAHRERIAELIEAGQTLDLLLRPVTPGLYPFYDRRQNVMNAGVFPGGQIAFLEVLPASGCVVAAHVAADGPVFYCQGDTVTFDASGSVAVGCAGSLTYQWREGLLDIPSAVAVTYTVPASKPVGTYQYTVVATCSTSPLCNDQSDPPASVTVASNATPPEVTNFQILDRDIWLQLSWSATPGAVTYRIYSDNSASGTFTALYASDITATSVTVSRPVLTTFFKVVAVNACGVEGPK